MNKNKRKNETSANRNSVKNEKRKENNFNSRDRDYENYYEFADESTVDPLGMPMTGANEVKSANQMVPRGLDYNREKRNKNKSLDD